MAIVVSSPQLPGPPALPLVGGNINQFQLLRDPALYLMRQYQAYGPLSGLVAGDLRQFFAIGPEYNRLLLSDTALFHTIFEALAPKHAKQRRRGVGLLNMNGAEHKQQRRLMMPAFHRKQVDGYRDTMVEFTQHMLDSWQAGQRRDIAADMQALTLRIACQTLFGLDVSQDSQRIGALVKRFLGTNLFAPEVMLFPVDLPGTPFQRMLETNARLEDEILALITRKRAMPGAQHDVLAALIHVRDEDGAALTDRELIGHTTTLLIAGHETSSNTLTWTLFLLAQHPHIFSDVVDEVTSVLHGSAPTVEQLGRLPLLERVVNESMRLLPPAAVMSRISTAPFEIGPYHAPKGTFITLSQYVTHRLPELYPEPYLFKPQRWETIDPSPYEYLPFGAGSRMCIGRTFALMEIKIVLAMLLQRFRVEVVPNAQIDHQVKITLSPKRGMPVVVHAQDQQFTKTPVRGSIHQLVDVA